MNISSFDNDLLNASYSAVKASFPDAKPQAGLIMGSGWGEACSGFEVLDSISYDKIPALGATGVEGHSGKLIWASRDGREALIFQGRRHVFEGVTATSIAAPLFILKSFGARAVVLTNAAGGIGDHLSPGDLMLIEDHINPSNYDPLRGSHGEFWGDQFTGLVDLYEPTLRENMRSAAEQSGVKLQSGCYAFWPAKPYQTPAEIRMLKSFGADAVGKSTVPEAILAKACGLQVCAISCISNYAAGIRDSRPTHEEVTVTVGKSIKDAARLFEAFWANWQG